MRAHLAMTTAAPVTWNDRTTKASAGGVTMTVSSVLKNVSAAAEAPSGVSYIKDRIILQMPRHHRGFAAEIGQNVAVSQVMDVPHNRPQAQLRSRSPTIAYFLGIAIAMYYRDHNPPHAT